MNQDEGWMYCFSNLSMPGLYKIGCTESADKTPEDRARELSTTGVPTPFEVQYKCLVSDPYKKEAILHEMLVQYRENQSREFFRCNLITISNFFDLMDNTAKFTAPLYAIKNEKVDMIIKAFFSNHLRPVPTTTILEDLVAYYTNYTMPTAEETDYMRKFAKALENRKTLLKLHAGLLKEVQANSIVQVVDHDFLWTQFNQKRLKEIEKYRITKAIFLECVRASYTDDALGKVGFFKTEATYKKYLDVTNHAAYQSCLKQPEQELQRGTPSQEEESLQKIDPLASHLLTNEQQSA